MIANWLKEFKTVSQKWRFISKLGTFVIAIFTLLNIYGFGRALYFERIGFIEIFGNLNEPHFLISFTFQIAILVTFTTRFALNFFNQSKIFWLNQILWLVGVLLFITLWDYTRPKSEIEAAFLHIPIFANFSQKLEGFAILYLILSPIWRVSMTIISLGKILKKK